MATAGSCSFLPVTEEEEAEEDAAEVVDTVAAAAAAAGPLPPIFRLAFAFLAWSKQNPSPFILSVFGDGFPHRRPFDGDMKVH